MLAGVDKIYHILSCALITVLAFFALLTTYNCINSKIDNKSDKDNAHHIASINDDDGDFELAAVPSAEESSASNMHKCTRIIYLPTRNYIIIMAIFSGGIAITIGILKEVFDAYNIIINGQASWDDILADVIGVIIGECIIVLYVIFCKKRGVG